MPTMSLLVDDKTFQRGQLWSELLETWNVQRDAFLQAAAQAPAREEWTSSLAKLPPLTRLLVYHRMRSPGSQAWIQELGPGLERAEKVESRFFAFEYFYPIFYGSLTREFPTLVLLDEQGAPVKTWAPHQRTPNQADWQHLLALIEN